MPTNYPRPLRRVEASEYLLNKWGISRKVSTLARLACEGGGPRFLRAARTPLYNPADLDAWAASILTPTAANTTEHNARDRAREAVG